MPGNKYKGNKYRNIALLILIILLVLALLKFVINSVAIVSQTNKDNFEYTIKIKNAIEEVDKIVERSGANLDTLVYTISQTYDIDKLHDIKYNEDYIKKIDILIKSALVNLTGVNGCWFQLNVDIPFSNKIYSWYGYENNKLVRFKQFSTRKLTPQNDSYYFEAVKNKKTIWSEIYNDKDNGIEMLSICSPIYKNGKLIGVVGIDISKDNLHQALRNIQRKFSNSEVFLLDSHGKVIIYQLKPNDNTKLNDRFLVSLFEKITIYPKGTSAKLVEYTDQGTYKTAIMLQLSNKYNIVVAFPKSEVFKGFKRLFTAIYFVFVIMTVLALIALINKKELIKINTKLLNETFKLRGILDASPNAILIKDLNGVYTDCNNKFLELVGMSKEDLIGKTDYDVFRKEEIPEIVENDEIVKSTKQTLVKETAFINKNGQILFIEKFIIPLLNEKQDLIGLLIIGFDISKQKEEQELLKAAKEEAEKATAMKSNFLANMSHEIRTPLNGVLGFIQLLKETQLTIEQTEFVDDAQKSSELLIEIINDILDFSKIEAGKLKIDNISFDVRSLVEDITLMLAANAEKKGLEVSSLICSDVPQRVFGDPGRIKQILNNLVGNAIKFTAQGEIVIYVKQVSESDETSVLSFEVKDTGIGIPKDKQSIIFEEFTQADASMTRKYGGTGLGLAICKKLVGLMNGQIKLNSVENIGSTFTFILPFKKDKTENEVFNNSLQMLDGAKILVISDNSTDLRIINYYLSEINCVIYEAKSCHEAFEIIDRESNNISVAILDYKFNDALINNKEILNTLPLILYTPLAKRGDSLWAKEKGFKGFLTKPIKKSELIEIIASAISNNNDYKVEKFATKHISKEKEFNSKAKILVVEDNEINCKLIIKILNRYKLFCDLAYNGNEAIKAFEANKYDLILMDCQIPGLDGYEATKLIRKIEGNSSHIPIVAMTANALAKDEEKCYEAGMDDYISKPVNIESMMKIIGKYIGYEENFTQEFSELSSDISNDISGIVSQMVSELALSEEESIQLFREYLEFLPGAILELENSLEQNDVEKMKQIAHKIKGSSSNLRIDVISQISADLEKALKENEGQEVYFKIAKQMKEYLEHLDTLFLQFVDNNNFAKNEY